MTDWGREPFALLTTFRKDGTGVPTTVWIAEAGDGRLVVTTSERTWKVRRLRADPRVTLQPSTRTGTPLAGRSTSTGQARVSTSEADLRLTNRALRAKYGVQFVLVRGMQALQSRIRRRPVGTCVLLITLDPA